MTMTTVDRPGSSVAEKISASASAGNRHLDLGHAHDDHVDDAAEIAGDHAEHRADRAGEHDRVERDDQRDTRAPAMMRLSMSRPRLSVPSRYS